MMHHPNMHHQQIPGPPPQHLIKHLNTSHQGMPAHHQIPPHQMHRENRHVPVHRVVGGSGVMSRSIRPMHAAPPPPHHHPHHPPPPPPPTHAQMKPVRRFTPQYAPFPPPHAAAAPAAPPASIPRTITNGPGTDSPVPPEPPAAKEKTPMCLVNELARYNKIKHQYRLTSETGPAHKKIFTVTLRLGDTEEYTAEGSSIKRAQHAAAAAALRDTALPAPPVRPHTHHTHPPRHHGTVMPTVELNALAMKLCQPAIYSAVPPPPKLYHPHMIYAELTYRMKVSVGGRSWVGSGGTPQSARHDAAARALAALRPQGDTGDEPAASADTTEHAGDGDANSDVKSPVSLVHELALKRNLSVVFSVKSERGPPHMRVFVTTCTVGDITTEGEGNGKKVSKRRAAENMVQEMKNRWGALARSRPPLINRRKAATVKKKPRNLIKTSDPPEGADEESPVSRVAGWCRSTRGPPPEYRVEGGRGGGYVVWCGAGGYRAAGHGTNKKVAKRRSAHNLLLLIENGGTNGEVTTNGSNSTESHNITTTDNNNEPPRKETEPSDTNSSEGRQPVPGVLMMDYHTRSKQTNGNTNGVIEESSTTSNQSPGAKDQLMYLSQLLGFTVQFSDFPKRNHGSYLSLVSLSTVPPVLCHGGGDSTDSSHEACARAALAALKDMGLDHTPQQTPQSSGPMTTIAE